MTPDMGKEHKRIAGLLLAAGASVRMGSPKQLLDVGGETLLDKTLGEALNSEMDEKRGPVINLEKRRPFHLNFIPWPGQLNRDAGSALTSARQIFQHFTPIQIYQGTGQSRLNL